MQEIVQERIKIISKASFLNIQSFYMHCEKDDHAYAEIQGIVDQEEDVDGYAGTEIVIYDASDGYRLLFSGIVEASEYSCEGMVAVLKLKCYSYTILMDKEEKNKSYQDLNMTYGQIIREIAGQENGYILYEGQDRKLDYPVIRYQETDWEFIKRLAAHLGTALVPVFYEKEIGIALGVNHDSVGKVDHQGKINYLISEDKKLQYKIESLEKWEVGDKILFKGSALCIADKESRFENGNLLYTYILAKEEYFRKEVYINRKLKGISLRGKVLAVKEEKMKVCLNIDEKQAEKEAYWFLYLPDTGNIMYCMPEVGEEVYLYMGCGQERDAVITNCIREGNGEKEGKFLEPPYGKKVLLDKTQMGYDSVSEKGHGRILLAGNEVAIQEKQKIRISAEETLTLKARNIQVIAPKEVTIMRRDMVKPSVINLCRFMDIIADGSGIQCTEKKENVHIEKEREEERYELGNVKDAVYAAIPFDGMQDNVAKCIIKSASYK